MVYLDRLFVHERVNVELDGAKWHRGDAQRERDIRRDAALASHGFLVVRYSHHQLMSDPDGVRRELSAILARRRCQLRAG
jgi:very-short-patch-repair endonuclease